MENDKFEILFWKVFHNKYIVRIIFRIIESTDWVEYQDFNQISFKNKKKFKHITSLEWMIKEKQYSLLKCKLESKDEYINIDTNGILSLFKIGSTAEEKETYYYGKPEPIKTTNIQDEIILLKHLLSLLMEYRYDEMIKFSLMTLAISCENLEAIKFLITSNNQYSKTVQPCESFLKYSILHSSPIIVDYFITSLTKNNTIPISESIKNQSILLSFKNENRKQMIKYILNNQIYNIPSSSSSFSTFPMKIDIDQLFSVPSNKIQNKLFQLNYFNQIEPNQFTNISKETIINIMMSNIDNDYIKFLKNIINSNNDLIMENLSINKPVNLEYIKYYTSIPNITFNSVTVKSLKSYILSSKDQISYKEAIEAISPLSMYSNNKDFFNPMFLRDIFPSTWNSILSSKMIPPPIIKDYETVDWIVENIKCLSNHFPISLEKIHFKTYQLIHYAIKKGLIKYENPSFYRYPFFAAIGECDIESLKYIKSNYDLKLEYKDFRPGQYEQYQRAITSSIRDKSIDQVNNLNEYLNSSGFSFFPITLHQNYIEIVTISNLDSYDISNVKIDFNINSKIYIPSIRYFAFAISKIYPKKIKFYLNNNYNPILTNCNQVSRDYISRYFSNIIYSIPLGNKIPKFQQSNYPFNNILECVEIFINLYKSSNCMGNDNISLITDNSNLTEILSLYEFILNYLFKKLIQNKSATFNQVNHVFQLIKNETSIEIEHSIYHSIHYLCIKSKKLIKYIMDLPFLVSIAQITGFGSSEVGFKCDGDYKDFKGYNIGKYLQSTIFTYEYIFNINTSFEQLLDHLIQQLSISPPLIDDGIIKYEKDLHNQDYFTTTLNFNLNYFLSIHRVDLFFNHLNMIYNIQSIFFSSNSTDTNGFYINDTIGNIKQELTLLNYSFNKKENCICFTDNSNDYIYHFNGKEFKISNSIYYKSSKIMTEFDFNKFIKFNSYHSFINILKSPITKKQFLFQYKNQINHILLNHLNNYDSNNNDSLLNNFWNKIK